MRTLILSAIVALLTGMFDVGSCPTAAAEQSPSPMTLWYAAPAKKWTEALPVGNGRLAAMVFGGISDEHLQFNEATVWTGQPHDYTHAGAAQQLPVLRKLLF